MDALLEALGFNWKILLANVINFLILLFLLSKIGLKPMKKFIEKRQQEIQEGIENAQKASSALAHAQEEAENLIAQAQKEASAILTKARENAETQAATLLTEQKEQMQRLAEKAKADIEIERQRVLKETSDQAVSFVLAATEKLLREKVDDDADRAYVEKVLTEIRS